MSQACTVMHTRNLFLWEKLRYFSYWIVWICFENRHCPLLSLLLERINKQVVEVVSLLLSAKLNRKRFSSHYYKSQFDKKYIVLYDNLSL